MTREPSRVHLVVLLGFVLFCVGAPLARGAIPPAERVVLDTLYAQTNGASWTNQTGWEGAAGTECSWHGIVCDDAGEHVIGLSLGYSYPGPSGNNLSGTLPSLSDLTRLQFVDLSRNGISGPFPAINNLGQLTRIDISHNEFSGALPDLNGLAKLQTFDAAFNAFGGSIPTFPASNSLVGYSIFQNQLTGSIPSLATLSAMRTFDVSANQLIGPIPDVTGLNALQSFFVSSNQLTGGFPVSLTQLPNAFYIDVSHNQLSGVIPDLSPLTTLSYLNLNDNQFTGDVPNPPASNQLQAELCPNPVNHSPSLSWDKATGITPWYRDCTLPGQSPTQTVLQSSANPAISGQFVALTAVVSGHSPSGVVTFYGSTLSEILCASVPLQVGSQTSTAICPLTRQRSDLTWNGYYAFAVYFEDAANSASRSALFEQDVKKADATLNIATTATSLTVGTPITISAELDPVSPGAGSPSGQILVVFGNNSSCVIVLPSGSCQLTPVDTGGATLTASYGGDVNFNSSTSNTLTFAPPHKADTQIVLTAGSNPSPPTPFLQAIVSGPELVLGGELEDLVIQEGTTVLCQFDSLGTGPLNGGYASCYSGVALTPGQHTLTATYSGDTNHNGSSTTLVLNVYDSGSSMSVSFSPNPARVGEPVTATFTVSASDPQFAPPSSPSGLVSLTVASPHAFCSAFLANTNSCTFTPSQVGTLGVSVSYSGDNYYRSAALATSLTVLTNMEEGGFFPLTPSRLLDTRAGFTTSDGQFAGSGPVGAGEQLDLLVAGRGGVPAQGATAVALNVTVTNPSASSYVTAWSSGPTRPLTSNLNFSVGQTVANLAIVPLGADRKVSLFNAFGTTDLIADVAGYFTTDADATVFMPSRLLDTRAGQLTFDGQFQGTGALAAGSVLDLTVGGRYGIPNTGVGAVILNVTAVHPTAPGYLTVWPDDAAQPISSNLNFTQGQIVANLVVGKVSSTGGVSIFNSAGTTDAVADVQGWFPLGSQFTAVVPARLMDSRPGAFTIDGQFAGIGALAPSSSTNLAVLGRGNVPSSGVSAVVLNVTATGPTAPGYLTVFQSGSVLPNSSNLNFVPGQTVPNLVMARVGSNGSVTLFNGTFGTTGVVVDVMGWFADRSP